MFKLNSKTALMKKRSMAFNRMQFLWAASAGAAGLALPSTGFAQQPDLALNSNWVWVPTLLGPWILTTSLLGAKK
jgi:hypothetical protein